MNKTNYYAIEVNPNVYQGSYFIHPLNNKYYKIIESDGHPGLFYNMKVKECKLEFYSFDLVPRDPEHSKEYDRVETYELVPFGRTKKIQNCLIFNDANDRIGYPYIDLYLQDKYVYKIVD